ncbi:hypothetical protein QTP86_008366 [Hemibagrus guttatus]|nr:hypothetical protein QTP86_008366 [Hemibagrus guttatus]
MEATALLAQEVVQADGGHSVVREGGVGVPARHFGLQGQTKPLLEHGQECWVITRPGRLAVINGAMNSAVYQKILKENVRPSVYELKLKRTWVLQQDNDPKHTSKSTSEWLKKNKMKTLEWPSQSPDLNPIEMLWHDFKKVVHSQKPSNVAELQQFCRDEWAKIPPQRCNRLIASYGKRLIAVVAAKGGPTSY